MAARAERREPRTSSLITSKLGTSTTSGIPSTETTSPSPKPEPSPLRASRGSPPYLFSTQSTEKSPVVLSEDKSFFFAIFLSISGKEYLAATSNTDNSIHLWDLETNTSKVVYKMDFKGRKDMTLCVIDENTVAYAEWSSEGMHRIHILNTDTEQWTLGNVILDKGSKFVRDICYVNTSDGYFLFGSLVAMTTRVCRPCSSLVEEPSGRSEKEKWGGSLIRTASVQTETGNAIYVSDFGKAHTAHPVGR